MSKNNLYSFLIGVSKPIIFILVLCLVYLSVRFFMRQNRDKECITYQSRVIDKYTKEYQVKNKFGKVIPNLIYTKYFVVTEDEEESEVGQYTYDSIMLLVDSIPRTKFVEIIEIK